MRWVSLSTVLAVTLAGASHARADDKLALAVLDLRDKGVGAELAANLTDILTASLTKLGVFQVLSRGDIQQMVEIESQKQMLGCDDAACLAEIGGALGVGLLITGSIGRVGDQWLLSLTLTNSAEVKVIAREQRTIAGETKLAGEVEGAARFLVRELLRGRQGDLILTASEGGAEVEIDGRIVGITPVGKQLLAGGPHTLKLHKKGFVSWAQDIDIRSEQATVIQATMVPSAEFIREYESRAALWRLAAYVSGGVAVAAVGFGLGGYLFNSERAAQYERDIVAAGCRAGDVGAAGRDCSEFSRRKGDIEGFQMAVVGSLIAGVVTTGVSAFLFWQGPDVDAYDAYHTAAGLEASIGVLPTPSGGALVGTLRF